MAPEIGTCLNLSSVNLGAFLKIFISFNYSYTGTEKVFLKAYAGSLREVR